MVEHHETDTTYLVVSLLFRFQGISLDLLCEMLLMLKEKRDIFVEFSGKYIVTNFVKESRK